MSRPNYRKLDFAYLEFKIRQYLKLQVRFFCIYILVISSSFILLVTVTFFGYVLSFIYMPLFNPFPCDAYSTPYDL